MNEKCRAGVEHYQLVLCTLLYSLLLCTVYCVLRTVHCAQCTVHCALCTVHCALCTVHCALCTVYCALCTVHCVLCAVYCALCAVCCVLCAVCCVLYTLCCALCTVSCVLWWCMLLCYCVMLNYVSCRKLLTSSLWPWSGVHIFVLGHIFWANLSRGGGECFEETTREKCWEPLMGLKVTTCSSYDLCHPG